MSLLRIDMTEAIFHVRGISSALVVRHEVVDESTSASRRSTPTGAPVGHRVVATPIVGSVLSQTPPESEV